MELKIEELKVPQEIKFNYEQLKRELSEKASLYATLAYSDDQIKAAKADRADLNRLKKALNDERIRREKDYMQPFNVFKEQVNEIIGIIDKPVSLIDKQIKEYEEQQKQEKRRRIEEFFSTYPHPEWLKLSQIWEERWLNASVSLKRAQEEIDGHIDNIEQDITTLSNLPEFAFEATEVYKHTLDLNKSIAEGRRLAEIQKRKAEQEEELPFTADRSKDNVKYPTIFTDESQMQYQAKEEVVQSPKEMPTYVCFKALLTVAQALELKEFFESRNIEFSRI